MGQLSKQEKQLLKEKKILQSQLMEIQALNNEVDPTEELERALKDATEVCMHQLKAGSRKCCY